MLKPLLKHIELLSDINRLIIQYGKQQTSNANWNVTFPITYTTNVTVTLGSKITGTNPYTFDYVKLTSHKGWFTDWANGIIYWISIGY